MKKGHTPKSAAPANHKIRVQIISRFADSLNRIIYNPTATCIVVIFIWVVTMFVLFGGLFYGY